MQHSSLTPDKELNILEYGMPFCVIIYRRCKLLKMVRFLALPVRVYVALCRSCVVKGELMFDNCLLPLSVSDMQSCSCVALNGLICVDTLMQ